MTSMATRFLLTPRSLSRTSVHRSLAIQPMRYAQRSATATALPSSFGVLPRQQQRGYASHHGAYGGEESFDAFTEKYVKFFKNEADDLFELSRGLNNCMSMDMVPAPEVLVAALECARKQNCFALALRVIAGLRQKVSPAVYKEYLAELRPAMDALGVPEPSEVGVDW